MKKLTYINLAAAVLLAFSAMVNLGGVAGAQGPAVKNGFTACQGVNCDNVLEIGGSMDVASGGDVDIESGGVLRIAGTDRTAALTTAPAAVAAGYKIARGATALDGSNPTPVATGLTTVIGCASTLRRNSAVTSGSAFLTNDAPSGANVDFYAWVLAGTASSGTETFDWVCVGT